MPQKSSTIKLSPIEQRYVSTCYPLRDRPFYEEALAWKEKLRKHSLENKIIEIPLIEIARAFPHLGRLYKKGIFEERSIQNYFEGIDNDSHNMRMYLFAKSIARKNPPEDVIADVLKHIEACSVKPADMRDNRVWSYGRAYHSNLDFNHLNVFPETDFVLVHGKSENRDIIIRDAIEEEFECLVEWFEKRQASRESPFARFKYY